MNAEDIRDRKTLEDWLSVQPLVSRQQLAVRIAMKIFPLWASRVASLPSGMKPRNALNELRVILAASTSVFVSGYRTYSAVPSDAGLSAGIHRYDEVAAHALDTIQLGVEFETDLAFEAANEAAFLASGSDTRPFYFGGGLSDALLLDEGRALMAEPLFVSAPSWFRDADQRMLEIWDGEPPARWQFWRRWWEGVKTGIYVDPALQLAIVQGVDDETWQDPDATARRIAEIEAQYFDGLGASSTGEGASKVAVPYAAVAEAMTRNRRELPAATGAVLGFIELEVERLQAKNYQSEEEAQESRRQIRVLQTIHEAVAKLEVLIPDGAQMNEADAVEVEKLMQLVVRRFKEWPRNKPGHCEDNAADLADTVIRCALVGAATQMLILIGAHASVAVGVSGALFGGKKIIEAIKAGPAQVG
jgi:hypothetical protein